MKKRIDLFNELGEIENQVHIFGHSKECHRMSENERKTKLTPTINRMTNIYDEVKTNSVLLEKRSGIMSAILRIILPPWH